MVLCALHVKDEETETQRGDVSEAAMTFMGSRYFWLPGQFSHKHKYICAHTCVYHCTLQLHWPKGKHINIINENIFFHFK